MPGYLQVSVPIYIKSSEYTSTFVIVQQTTKTLKSTSNCVHTRHNYIYIVLVPLSIIYCVHGYMKGSCLQTSLKELIWSPMKILLVSIISYYLSSPSLDLSQGNTHASFVALLQWYWCWSAWPQSASSADKITDCHYKLSTTGSTGLRWCAQVTALHSTREKQKNKTT